MKLFSSENAHWYRPDGQAMHSVLSAKGEPRPTTLRDARKLGLLPSVTNVLGVINKPELVEWKMTQAVLAALTLPRLDGEGEDAFAKRVVEDAQSRVKTAVDFGSAFHAGAEAMAKAESRKLKAEIEEILAGSPVAAWLNLHREWFQANAVRLVWTERVLVNAELGYAGTADLLIEHQQHGLTLVDYKTQGGGGQRSEVGGQRSAGNVDAFGESALPGWRPRAYPSWCQQLAAYRRAIGQPMACMNVIVNSTEPTALVEHVWNEEELRAGLESFEAALVIWRNEKVYDPRGERSGGKQTGDRRLETGDVKPKAEVGGQKPEVRGKAD